MKSFGKGCNIQTDTLLTKFSVSFSRYHSYILNYMNCIYSENDYIHLTTIGNFGGYFRPKGHGGGI